MAFKDIANDYVDMTINQTTSILPYIQGDLIKGIMTSAQERSSIIPDVPTSQETGLAELNIQGWNMVFVPKGTNPERILKLNQIFTTALQNKFLKGKFKLSDTLLIPAAQNNVSTLRRFIKSQLNYWRDVITIFDKKNSPYESR